MYNTQYVTVAPPPTLTHAPSPLRLVPTLSCGASLWPLQTGSHGSGTSPLAHSLKVR